jgi:hypothetical protein
LHPLVVCDCIIVRFFFFYIAICTGDCSNLGTCVAPETCDCQDGWTGNQCSEGQVHYYSKVSAYDDAADFNECDAGVCNNCTNTVGSFQCTCPDGITLSPGQTCVDPPGMLSTSHITSSSMLISWEPPTITQQDELLQNYALSCSASGTSRTEAPMTIESSATSVTVPNLAPNTIYTCCIRAITTAGQSPNVCTMNSTLEDVPSTPPENVTVVAVSPFAVEVEWEPPATPNGVVIHYNVYTSHGVLVDTVNSSQRNYVYSGLTPYQSVSVCVSANTSVGEGPKSQPVTARTRESAPSEVESYEVVVLSEASFNVSWNPPRLPNGVLTGYQLAVIDLVLGRGSPITVSPNTLEVTVNSGVEPYVPYEISVRAANSAGVGEAREIVIFTKEGVPLVAPTILTLQRTNSTSALIEWKPLRPQDLRGNPTSHLLVYSKQSDSCPTVPESFENSTRVEALSPAYFLTEVLDPRHEYCVGIAAVTGAGTGVFSYKSVSWFDSASFSLVIEVTFCSQWIEELPVDKARDLTDEISRGVSQYCQCVFPSDYLTDTMFVCDDSRRDVVRFEGQIIGTNEQDSGSLKENMQQWVSSEPTVTVQEEQVQVVNPTNQEENEDSHVPSVAIGVSIAGVILLVLALVVFAAVCATYIRCKRHGSKQGAERDQLEISTSTSIDSPTVTDLKNPYYGYGVHAQAVKEVENPTYGLNEVKKGKDPISNPLYGANTLPGVQLPSSSGSGLYSEIPTSREECFYEETKHL